MISFRVVVKRGEEEISQGTAWFVTPQLVVTAFHVVAPESSSDWFHEVDNAYYYVLFFDHGSAAVPVALEAVLAHSCADIALLRADRSVPEAVVLPISGAETETQASWQSEGFPALRSGKRFTLSGTVATIEGLQANQALQLTVAQGTYRPEKAAPGKEKPLGGFSGGPIVDRDRVVGLMTSVASNMNTAFAAKAASIRELLLAHACGEALIAHPAIDLAKLAAALSSEAADEAGDRRHQVRKLLEHALRSGAGPSLRTIIDIVSQHAPKIPAELRSGLYTIEPADQAIDRLVAEWVKQNAVQCLQKHNLISTLPDRLAEWAGGRPVLAMAIRAMAVLAYSQQHALVDTNYRRVLKILIFHYRRLLYALDNAPAVLHELTGGDNTATRAIAAEVVTDLGIELRSIENAGQSGRHIADQLRALSGFTSSQPPLDIPLLDLGHGYRFLFSSRAVPLLGRESEIAAANAFLDAKPPYAKPPFAWWLVLGPAGSGKSRFALELCLRHRLVWRTGFLSADTQFNWSAWQPSQPTLIVADDAASRADELHAMVNALRVRTDLQWPVRLLIVERFGKVQPSEDQFTEESWYDRFVGRAGSAALAQAACFGPPLELPRLIDAALRNVIGAAAQQAGGITPAQQDAAVQALRQLDPEGRPLFAALLGDALAREGNALRWDPVALLKSVLDHEEERWQAQNVTVPEKNLLALATMIAGVELSVIEPHLRPDILPNAEQFSPPRYRSLSGREATDKLAPLEPDILGELFVLERVRPAFSLDTKRVTVLRQLSWRLKPQSMAAFLERTARDFPWHAALPLLLVSEGPTPETGVLWSRVAVNTAFYTSQVGATSIATEIYQSLQRFADDSHDPAVQLRQARCAANLIVTFRTDPTQARRFYDDLDGLVADAAAGSGVREAFARGTHNMVRTYLDKGNATESLAIYKRIKGVAADHPEEVALRHDQARCAYNLLGWHATHRDASTAYRMYDELADLSSQYDDATLRTLQAKGGVNLISPLPAGADRIIADLDKLVKDHPADQELVRQYAMGLSNAIPKSPLDMGRKYFTELEGLFVDTDNVMAKFIVAKAAGDLIDGYGRDGKLRQARILYNTKVADLEFGDDLRLCGVQAWTIEHLINSYLMHGKPEPATKIYKGDLTRLVNKYPDSQDVLKSYRTSAAALKKFGGFGDL